MKSMQVYEAMAKESAGNFSVGDEVSITDVCLVAMVQMVQGFGMRFEEAWGYPTTERIVETCEGIDTFRHQGASKALQVKGFPLVWVDKVAASWIGLEPRSTSSRKSSLETESFKLLRDSSTGSRREISPGNQAKIVESRLQRRYLEAKLSRLDEQYQRLLATQLFFHAYCSTK